VIGSGATAPHSENDGDQRDAEDDGSRSPGPIADQMEHGARNQRSGGVRCLRGLNRPGELVRDLGGEAERRELLLTGDGDRFWNRRQDNARRSLEAGFERQKVVGLPVDLDQGPCGVVGGAVIRRLEHRQKIEERPTVAMRAAPGTDSYRPPTVRAELVLSDHPSMISSGPREIVGEARPDLAADTRLPRRPTVNRWSEKPPSPEAPPRIRRVEGRRPR
jgi:hypothetical protein